jgi:hypothetical protein
MPKTNLAIRREELAPAAADYVRLAIERNLPPEIFAKLLDNAERVDAIRARKDFEAALTAAKAEMPQILKNREVSFGNTNYKHEDFAGLAGQVDPVISKHGLSYRFRTNSDKDGITVTCIVSGHGHHEENSLWAPHDKSGNKNAIQAIGSAQTYLQRYTLKAALGLAASADTDARVIEAERVPDETITLAQFKELETLCAQKKRTVKALATAMGVQTIAELPASRLSEAKGIISDAQVPA